jgi:hypothetical protein
MWHSKLAKGMADYALNFQARDHTAIRIGRVVDRWYWLDAERP